MRAMSTSGHDPASSGAAASSFAHIGSDDQMDDADGEQALILEGADGETEHLQGHQQGQVRVQGQQQGQSAPTNASSGNEPGPSVSQFNTPERHGQGERLGDDLPPDSWSHPQAKGPPRRVAPQPGRTPAQVAADAEAWTKWNQGRPETHQFIDVVHRWEKQSQPAPAENWSSEHWGQEAWDETAWNESGWDEGGWSESAYAQPRATNSSAARLLSEEGKDQKTASAPGCPSDDKELVTVDKLKSLLPMMMDLHLERHNQISTKLRNNEDEESVISKDKEREATRPYVRHRDNGFGLLYAQQAQKNQEIMLSETTYAPPSSVLKVSGLGTDRPATMYRKDLPERIYIDLMGPRPTEDEIWKNHHEQWYNSELAKYSMKDFPKWDGANEAKTMKPWLKECKRWRKNTSVGLRHHGRALQLSFARGSWMRAICDLLDEDQLEKHDSYEHIMRNIIYEKKWIFEHEAEVAIEEYFFLLWRHNHEAFSSFFTRFDQAEVKLKLQLGYRNVRCEFCKNDLKISNQIPDVVRHYLLKKKTSLTRDQHEKIQDWFGENFTLEDFVRACNKFDSKSERKDIARLCRQQPALSAGVYMVTDEPSNEPITKNQEPARLLSVPEEKPKENRPEGTEPESIIISGELPSVDDNSSGKNFMIGSQNPDDGNVWEIDDESSSDSSYDWEYFDDDGHPLVDQEDDSVYVPMDKDLWYTEDEADKLVIFAVSYRETRSGLQKTKIGRDQKRVIKYHKNYGKSKGKGRGRPHKMGFKKKGGKGRDPSRPFLRPKAKPRAAHYKRSTPFKRKIGGSSTRGTWKALKQRTRCNKCGDLGHHGRECKKDDASAAANKAIALKKAPPRNKEVIHFAFLSQGNYHFVTKQCIDTVEIQYAILDRYSIDTVSISSFRLRTSSFQLLVLASGSVFQFPAPDFLLVAPSS